MNDIRNNYNLITIGDSFDLLPELDSHSVDLILTDPPYEESAHTCQRRTRAVIEGKTGDILTVSRGV